MTPGTPRKTRMYEESVYKHMSQADDVGVLGGKIGEEDPRRD